MPETPLPTGPAPALSRKTAFAALLGVALLCQPNVISQTTSTGADLVAPARSWIVDAVANQNSVVDRRGVYLRYRTHRVDAKIDVVRDIIETPQGAVARLVQRNGHTLTSAEDAAERARLANDMNSPADFARHHRRDDENRKTTLDLVKLMPDAMLYRYAPDQPQLLGVPGQQVVLDFKPNPSFHPPTVAADLLTGLQGRIWIDSSSRHMERMEAQVIHSINLLWGIAHVNPGGKLEFEQTDAGGGVWVYSHLVFDHVSIREVLVKTQVLDSTTTDSQFERLPGPLTYQDAIRRLLDTPLR